MHRALHAAAVEVAESPQISSRGGGYSRFIGEGNLGAGNGIGEIGIAGFVLHMYGLANGVGAAVGRVLHDEAYVVHTRVRVFVVSESGTGGDCIVAEIPVIGGIAGPSG